MASTTRLFLCLSFLSLTLLGCTSSSQSTRHNTKQYTAGYSVGDTTSLFWLTMVDGRVSSAADDVHSSIRDWYQTIYHWQDEHLQEVIRRGVVNVQNELKPFTLHLRFDQHGEAIYQMYRVDGKVYPLSSEKIAVYHQQAQHAVHTVQTQKKEHLALIQGFWNGEQFESCTGEQYARIEFNQTLPQMVLSRLSHLNNYLLLVGQIKRDQVIVDQLLALDSEERECILRPDFSLR